jgi:hypothetical protein
LIALIINAHQFERDGIDVEFVSLYRTCASRCATVLRAT